MTGHLDAAVSAPHRLANEAGERVLAAGGSAVDAAIAASAVLCVVYPHMVTLGGDAWAIVDDPDAGVQAVDGTGRAPRDASAELVRAAGHASMPEHGPFVVTTPGGIASWSLMHERFGRLPFVELFTEAIALAEDGVPIASSLARDIVACRDRLAADPGCRALFLDAAGDPRPEGDILLQPELGRVLRAIAEGGADAFYNGELGGAYASGLAALGVPITAADLVGQVAEWVAPLSVDYRGFEAFTAPANSQGFVLLQLLRAADRDGIRWSSISAASKALPGVVEAVGSLRDRVLGDPAVMNRTSEELAGAAVLDEALAEAAAGTAGSSPTLTGDTAAIVTLDSRGQGVSLIQSVCGAFGSGLLERSTGILAHNRGSAYTLDAGSVAELVGGRKPPHTLMPAVLRRDGALHAVVGTMGGKNQPTILAQVIDAVVEGYSAQDAVDRPRWVAPVVTQQQRREVLAESGLGAEAHAILAESGMPVVSLETIDNRVGQAQAIIRTATGVDRGTDRRADGL